MTLRVENVAFGYRRGTPVLRGVSASFKQSSVCAVVGPNGAGKSTLLRIMAGLLRPWSGTVEHDGRAVRSLRGGARARRIAYVPQRPDVAGAFSVRQLVRFARHAVGRDEVAVQRAMETMRIDARADDVFGTLSAGQQQRAALARALAQLDGAGEGRVLLVDEPVAAMDPAHALHAMRVLRGLADSGVSVVAAIHDLTMARRFADSALALTSRGEAGAFGPARSALSAAALATVFGVDFIEARIGAGPDGFDAIVPVEGHGVGDADTMRA